jgi:hypothetical protein
VKQFHLEDYVSDDMEIYNTFTNRDPIIIDNFNIVNGMIIVHLSANGLGGEMCDNPRITAQLNQILL